MKLMSEKKNTSQNHECHGIVGVSELCKVFVGYYFFDESEFLRVWSMIWLVLLTDWISILMTISFFIFLVHCRSKFS